MPLVTSGVEHGNLRELALQRMRDLGTECRDVRTREVGIQDIHHKVQPDQVKNCDEHVELMLILYRHTFETTKITKQTFIFLKKRLNSSDATTLQMVAGKPFYLTKTRDKTSLSASCVSANPLRQCFAKS